MRNKITDYWFSRFDFHHDQALSSPSPPKREHVRRKMMMEISVQHKIATLDWCAHCVQPIHFDYCIIGLDVICCGGRKSMCNFNANIPFDWNFTTLAWHSINSFTQAMCVMTLSPNFFSGFFFAEIFSLEHRCWWGKSENYRDIVKYNGKKLVFMWFLLDFDVLHIMSIMKCVCVYRWVWFG